MNKIAAIFLSCIILSACKQKRPGEITANADTAYIAIDKHDSAGMKTDSHYSWMAVPDDKSSKFFLKKEQAMSIDSLTPDIVIRKINDRYADIKLELVKISGDTIFVKIRDSNFLTRQMGSSGADMYMTEASFNLTELININYVHFSFKEGDHASPGTYSRTDFENVKF